MSTFLAWNDAIASSFFRPERSGQPVWLDVTEDLIATIGSALGAGGAPEFVSSMKEGPPWSTPAGLCQRALKTCEGWRGRQLDFPPYVGFLALFVLAAGLEGHFASHAYYPRLRTLLGEAPTTGQLPSFDRMYELWDDLERWSVQDRNGELGVIEARIAGGMFHIGLPLGQSVLAAEDRRALPIIFARAGLDPSSVPSDAELIRALRTHGAGLLRTRTSRIIEGTGDPEKLSALMDLVAEELTQWDGEVAVPSPGPGGSQREVHAGLRLSLRLDRIAGRCQVSLRCVLNRREFPEEGLVISLGSGGETSCIEEVPGWSTPLVDSGVGEPFDALQIDWTAGCSATESALGWRFRLAPSPVRVLQTGESFGLAGLVEVPQVIGDRPFYLLFHDREWPNLEQWSVRFCEGFEPLAISEGIPAGWKMAYCAGLRASDEAIGRRYPALARPERVGLRLVGGIRSSAGNNFFAFAPPRVELAAARTDLQVRCAGNELAAEPDGTTFTLPDQLPTETRILVEALTSDNDVRRRLSLYLTAEFAWNRVQPLELFDQWGDPMPAPTGDDRIAGALLDISNLPTFTPPILLARGLAPHLSRRVFLIGRGIGEISVWPSEPLPEAWRPIWAVPMVRRGTAIYCGGGIDVSTPISDRIGDGERVELWREVLWHRRKRIAPPSVADHDHGTT